MRIYGAGLAGLLTANILRRFNPTVYEAQSSLPNNHDALLRFRSDAVSRATGIAFKKVTVQKAIWMDGKIVDGPNLQLSNKYAKKVTDEVIGRSIDNLAPVERFIAPTDLVGQLAIGLNIKYGTSLRNFGEVGGAEPTISTIPMPFLMGLADWKDVPKFNYRPIVSITADILSPKVDVYQTLYYPGNELQYRASLTGNRLIIEMIQTPRLKLMVGPREADEVILKVARHFGIEQLDGVTIPIIKYQSFGKIAPIPDKARKSFILAMSDQYNIYSIGRYATWRNILLDDVVKDVEVVEAFINQRDSYRYKLAAHQ